MRRAGKKLLGRQRTEIYIDVKGVGVNFKNMKKKRKKGKEKQAINTTKCQLVFSTSWYLTYQLHNVRIHSRYTDLRFHTPNLEDKAKLIDLTLKTT